MYSFYTLRIASQFVKLNEGFDSVTVHPFDFSLRTNTIFFVSLSYMASAFYSSFCNFLRLASQLNLPSRLINRERE